MNNLSYYEKLQRGTPEFPLELYKIDLSHPRYEMQMHWHKDFEIIRVTKGVLELKLNESSLTLSENQSIFIPGGIIHSGNPKYCRYECLVFSPSILYNIKNCRSLIKTYMQEPVLYQNNSNIDFVFEEMQNKNLGFELNVIGKLYLLAGDIVKRGESYAVAPNEKIERIKSAMLMIEENYSSKITLEDLADSCRLSPNYFSKYFKEVVGQTPFEYITVYRIENACEMLLEENRSITDVCYSCGFNDLSYFIHVFKKYKGMSPKAYVKNISL